jgi:hypothetical protein
VLFAFTAGTLISQAFELPTDLSDVLDVRYNHSFQMPIKDYLMIFQELNDNKFLNYTTDVQRSTEMFATIIQGKYLVLFNKNQL